VQRQGTHQKSPFCPLPLLYTALMQPSHLYALLASIDNTSMIRRGRREWKCSARAVLLPGELGISSRNMSRSLRL
jgi:hypothetical protein